MNGRSLGKFIPPAGPLLSLLLIGLVLLSALLYYRAIKIQRSWSHRPPAPNEFAEHRLTFQKEFSRIDAKY
jgi:hypothetical protein